MHDEGTVMNLAVPTLKDDEGCKLTAYQDTRGIWTIGYGLNLQTLRFSQADADVWLMRKYSWAQEEAKKLPAFDTLSTVRKAVLISMVYQLGPAGVRKFIGMFDGITTGNFDKAADEMLDSAWHSQTPNRCERMAQRMRTDKWEV